MEQRRAVRMLKRRACSRGALPCSMMHPAGKRSDRIGRVGRHCRLLLVLLLLGHLGVMALPTVSIGSEMLGVSASDPEMVASDAQITPAPMSCPAGAGDCMLAWAPARAAGGFSGSTDHPATTDTFPLVAAGPAPVPASNALSPPQRGDLQTLLQVFRL